MVNEYALGQTIKLSTGDTAAGGGFRTAAGALADPDVVELHVIAATGVETVFTYGTDTIVQRAGQGDYFAIIEGTVAGDWEWYWRGITNSVPSRTVAVAAGQFRVLLP
jgi:hypothetical protein